MKKEKQKRLPIWAWVLIVVGIIIGIVILAVIVGILGLLHFLVTSGGSCDISDLSPLNDFVGRTILVENNTYLMEDKWGSWKIAKYSYQINENSTLIPQGNFIKINSFELEESSIDKPSVIYIIGTWEGNKGKTQFKTIFAVGHAPGMKPIIEYPSWSQEFNNVSISSLEKYFTTCGKLGK